MPSVVSSTPIRRHTYVLKYKARATLYNFIFLSAYYFIPWLLLDLYLSGHSILCFCDLFIVRSFTFAIFFWTNPYSSLSSFLFQFVRGFGGLFYLRDLYSFVCLKLQYLLRQYFPVRFLQVTVKLWPSFWDRCRYFHTCRTIPSFASGGMWIIVQKSWVLG